MGARQLPHTLPVRLICGVVCRSESELARAKWVLNTVTVANHYARSDEDHTDLGKTKGGTPIKIDSRFVTAAYKVVVGLVEPHFMAGYSGGRKLITPGVAAYETIATVHSSRFMSHPRCKELLLKGNPLHEEQVEIVETLTASRGPIHAVNTVLDDQRRLCYVNYGDIVASHYAAVDYVRGFAEVSVPCRFATVVTSAAGLSSPASVPVLSRGYNPQWRAYP